MQDISPSFSSTSFARDLCFLSFTAYACTMILDNDVPPGYQSFSSTCHFSTLMNSFANLSSVKLDVATPDAPDTLHENALLHGLPVRCASSGRKKCFREKRTSKRERKRQRDRKRENKRKTEMKRRENAPRSEKSRAENNFSKPISTFHRSGPPETKFDVLIKCQSGSFNRSHVTLQRSRLIVRVARTHDSCLELMESRLLLRRTDFRFPFLRNMHYRA